MLGVCYGNSLVRGVKPEDKTYVMHTKGNTELTVNPFDELSVRKIKYKADGSISTSDDADINKRCDRDIELELPGTFVTTDTEKCFDGREE